MRPIKYRGWIGIGINKMFYDIQDSPKCYDLETFGDWVHCLACHVMPYTGLKDKNGKEIYEGDIVKFCIAHFPSLAREQGREPTLSDERICRIRVEHLTTYITEIEVGDNVWVLDLVNVDMIERGTASIEVIGNIYENPELLEVKEWK